jgi:hypothetical protein
MFHHPAHVQLSCWLLLLLKKKKKILIKSVVEPGQLDPIRLFWRDPIITVYICSLQCCGSRISKDVKLLGWIRLQVKDGKNDK